MKTAMAAAVSSRPSCVLRLMFGAILILNLKVSNGAVYKVGDSEGWTSFGNVDYKEWAATKRFHVGDTIVFEYNPLFHNVIEVTHAAYRACNASSPISIHTSGNDSIAITTLHRHHFYICGVPGHCEAGQKVDINVRRGRSVAPSPLEVRPSVLAVSSNVAVPWPFGKFRLLQLLILHISAVLLL